MSAIESTRVLLALGGTRCSALGAVLVLWSGLVATLQMGSKYHFFIVLFIHGVLGGCTCGGDMSRILYRRGGT